MWAWIWDVAGDSIAWVCLSLPHLVITVTSMIVDDWGIDVCMDTEEKVMGYIIFKSDGENVDFRFEVGVRYRPEDILGYKENTFNFHREAMECFLWNRFDPKSRVLSIEALGEVSHDCDGREYLTDEILFVGELCWEEVLRLANTGYCCTGVENAGDRNTGDYNTGCHNVGDHNSGHHNTGNNNTGCYNVGSENVGNNNVGQRNTGSYNVGHCNGGYRNVGFYNIGHHNTGHYNGGDYNAGDFNRGGFNTGDFNTGDHNTGCFNSCESTIRMFNRMSNWTLKDWRRSRAREVLKKIPCMSLLWVDSDDMEEKEIVEHSNCDIVGGYLKDVSDITLNQDWWDSLSEEDRRSVLSLPNFDCKVFREITGIVVV